MKLSVNKINFAQMLNDSKGKTDVSLVCGFLCVVVGLGGFLCSGNLLAYMVIFETEKDANVLSFLNMLLLQSAGLVTVGLAAIGVNRVTKDKEIAPEASQ
ncbi:MAG: hypothetical protein MUE38_05790 [Flavihumibacter sp.]|jgi:hypothetical protein|nr:hypothetical protein [Flavihumibacter sp.]